MSSLVFSEEIIVFVGGRSVFQDLCSLFFIFFFFSACYFVLGVTDFFQMSSNPRLLTYDVVPMS